MITRTNPEWPPIRQWLTDRINQARTELESVRLDDRTTSVLRGKIAAWRALIAAVEPNDDTTAGTPANYNP